MTKSPTVRLLLGLLITLAAVTGFSSYALYQLRGLRNLQADTIDRNRHDTLQLLQLQNDVNMIGLKLRDMIDEPKSSGISRYRERFDQLHRDLNQAMLREENLTPLTRRPDQQAELLEAARLFWDDSDAVFAQASAGNETNARALASARLFPQQRYLANLVAGLLRRNNAAEEEADEKVSNIYDGVEKDIYIFLAGTMLAILVTSLYLIYSNRRLFGKLQSYSLRHRVLAARLITVQEEVLRSVSRELHDEFGQILTAVGAMLSRAEKKGVPPDSPLRTELSEIKQITHNTLEKIRSLSQMLHPAVIDDHGLAKAIEWYGGVFERQTGIETVSRITGSPERIVGQPAIHCFRIVQEALNNAAKHSGSRRAEVEVDFQESFLVVKVKDFGCGIPVTRETERSGLGLIAMRERAELPHGTLDITSAANVGTTVSVRMPLRQEDLAGDEIKQESREEELAAQHD